MENIKEKKILDETKRPMRPEWIDEGKTYRLRGREFSVRDAAGNLTRAFKGWVRRGVLSAPAGWEVRGGRVLSKEKLNITRGFKASDWKNLGFTTAKQGKEFTRKLKKRGVPVNSQEDLDRLSVVFKQADNVLSHKYFKKMDNYSKLITRMVVKNRGRFTIRRDQVGYRGSTDSYELTRIGQINDVYAYFAHTKLIAMRKIMASLMRHGACKFYINTQVLFKRFVEEAGEWVRQSSTFLSKPIIVSHAGEIEGKVDEAVQQLTEKVEKYVSAGSGWEVENVQKTFINVHRFQLTRGSSYFPMTPHLKRKVLNVKNHDNRCFLYCLVAALHGDELDLKHPDRLKQFERFFAVYPFDDGDMPMSVNLTKKIKKYEDIVKRNIVILRNVHGHNEIFPFHVSDNSYDETIVLLLCQNLATGQNHFVLVPNTSKLLSRSIQKNGRKLYFCYRCLSHFTKESILHEHTELCKNHEITKVTMPKYDTLKFSSIKKMLKLPFVVYADFECLILSDKEHEPCGAKYQIVYSCDGEESVVVRKFLYRGEGCVELMMESLKQDCDELYDEYFRNSKPLAMTPEDNRAFRESGSCHICGERGFANYHENQAHWAKERKPHPLSKVRDHCHVSGKFRGAAHHTCNLQYQVSKVFPVVFHNLKGYDGNLIIKRLKKEYADKISVIPQNQEKFISFTLGVDRSEVERERLTRDYCKVTGKSDMVYCPSEAPQINVEDQACIERECAKLAPSYEIRFIDSLAFLNSSLDKLAKCLDEDDYVFTNQYVNSISEDNSRRKLLFKLLKRKGIYPYEYMDSWSRLDETKLPSVEHFTSSLKHTTKEFCKLSGKEQKELEADYEHAQEVWREFGCETMGDYHNLYLESDVCLLTDIFEHFRKISMDKFKLDPAHYFTLPGMAWDAMLKYTGVNLHLFTEEEREFYLKMESAKIGGISGTGGKRYSKANNKYLLDWDKTKTSSYIIYADANGLYSWAMMQKLPIGEFEMCEDFDLSLLGDCDGDYGYFVNGDFEIPDELHDQMNDYPCFPENLCVKDEWLGDYQRQVRECLDKLAVEQDSKVAKLIPNLMPKTNYTIHFKLLKLYLDLGCRVTKINWAMRFKQEAWLAPYIDLCMTERSKSGVTEFEKEFWKLCCNAVYGKTMENVRNRLNSELVYHDQERFDKLVNQNYYKSYVKINDDLSLVNRHKHSVTLCKPIYVGVAVLNLSKWLMYDFFYNTLRVKYPDATMIYTDTDSFIFEVKTDDFYKDLLDEGFVDKWDLSNYSVDHPIFASMSAEEAETLTQKNRKKVGLFKDEMGGKAVSEAVALRAKMYSLLTAGGEQKNTAKGVVKPVRESTNHDKYRDCIFHGFDKGKVTLHADMSYIRSVNHKVESKTSSKVTLCGYDDKKVIMKDGVNQLSYGHRLLRSNNL